jgi:hypothetical protein
MVTLTRISLGGVMRFLKVFWMAGVAALVLTGCEDSSSGTTEASKEAVNAADLRLKSDGTVTAANLIAYSKAKLAFTPKDEFSKGFDDSALEGRHFRVRQPVSDSGAVHYGYDPEKEVLSIFISPYSTVQYRDAGGPGPDYDYFALSTDLAHGQPRKMSNAFGAEREVTSSYLTEFGVGSIGRDHMGVPSRAEYGGYDIASRHIPMKPDEARAVTANLYVLIEGVVRKSSAGSTIDCGESQTSPTLNYPSELHWKGCVVSAKIERIQVISPKAGVLLALPKG